MKYYKVIFVDICFILICYVDIIVSNDSKLPKLLFPKVYLITI